MQNVVVSRNFLKKQVGKYLVTPENKSPLTDGVATDSLELSNMKVCHVTDVKHSYDFESFGCGTVMIGVVATMPTAVKVKKLPTKIVFNGLDFLDEENNVVKNANLVVFTKDEIVVKA